jgi:hypothetical protein
MPFTIASIILERIVKALVIAASIVVSLGCSNIGTLGPVFIVSSCPIYEEKDRSGLFFIFYLLACHF